MGNKDNPRNVKNLVLVVLVSVVVACAFTIIFTIGILSGECWEQRYIFVREYNADYNSRNETTLKSCKGCLWIEAMPIDNTYILGFKHNPPTNNSYQSELVESYSQKLFFAGESLLKGYDPYSEISIRWCRTPYGNRIRGVRSVK